MRSTEEIKKRSMSRILELCRSKQIKFRDIICGKQVIRVALERIPGFNSIELKNNDNIRYFVIDNKKTDKEIEEEIKFLLKDELKEFTEEEKKDINSEYIKYHGNKRFLKGLSYGDVEKIIKKYNLSYIEYDKAHELLEMYRKIRYRENRISEDKYCTIAVAFKLGEMKGKRAERRRYKYTGVKKYIIDIIKRLEDIKKLNMIFYFIKGIEGDNNKVTDKSMTEENEMLKLFNQLNEEGRKQAIDSIEELTYILKYNAK